MISLLKSFSLLLLISIFLIIANNVRSLDNEVFISPLPATRGELYSHKVTTGNFSSNNIETKQDKLSTPSATITSKPESKKKELKILIIGDSLILHGFGPQLEKDLSALENVKVKREGQYNTGLNRINYFDWYKETSQLLEKDKQDYLIVMFGSNDGQEIITPDGVHIQLYSSGWEDAYRERVKVFMDLVSPKVSKVFWIGQPIPGNKDFYKKFTIFNSIYDEESKNYNNITYINTWDRFAVNGKFSQIVADDAGQSGVVKENDGVHLTVHGSKILSRFVINIIKVLN